MSALTPFLKDKDVFIELRRDLHKHPEIAFQERRTSQVVAETLREYGIETHTGLAGTGVVGVLRVGQSEKSIGLRADMDALPMQEENVFAHRSCHDGKMHACGHDGHTTMLLAAAKHLAETRRFDGVVNFIFQPAEENEGGARVMVEEGLFDAFPMEAVFGMHNMPMLPLGTFVARPGPLMAGFDVFTITVRGTGGHAAIPQYVKDPIVAASNLVGALQAIVARNVDPLKSAVLSVTQIHGGDSFNVIPQEVKVCGTVRYFDRAVGDEVERRIAETAAGLGAAFGVAADVAYERRYPPTVNDPQEAAFCSDVLAATFGETCLDATVPPLMGSEDFAFMLQHKRGCYIWAGTRADDRGGVSLHNPNYDFNDDLIPYGAAYWARLVEMRLSAA
ncbi:MAG: M20 aminoacylase family protein [Pseudomonadota bacterium]